MTLPFIKTYIFSKKTGKTPLFSAYKCYNLVEEEVSYE